MKIGLSSKLDEIDTEMGSCLPTHVVRLFSAELFSATQRDSKSKTARLSKRRMFSGTNISNWESFSNTVSLKLDAEQGYLFFTNLSQTAECRRKFECFEKNFVAIITSETIENSVDILRVTNVIIIPPEFDALRVFVYTPM